MLDPDTTRPARPHILIPSAMTLFPKKDHICRFQVDMNWAGGGGHYSMQAHCERSRGTQTVL